MAISKSTDIVEKIREFQTAFLSQKPSLHKMVHEVQMMNFKVRPLAGNIAELDYSNHEFIGALWSLGKLDEFFRHEFPQVQEKQKDAFFRIVNDLRVNLQNQLRQANISGIEFEGSPSPGFFEMEIIKDNNLHVN